MVELMNRVWTVEDHLRDKPADSVALYRRFVELLGEFGPFETLPAKTTITFKGVRRGFAGARPTTAGIAGYLDLQRVVEGGQIGRVEPYTKRLFTHQYRITSADQFDERFIGWMREAYEVGAGAHMR